MFLGWVVSSYSAVAEAIMALFSSGENSGSRNIMREEFIKTIEEEIASWGRKWAEQIERCENILPSSCVMEKLQSSLDELMRELDTAHSALGISLVKEREGQDEFHELLGQLRQAAKVQGETDTKSFNVT